MITNINNATHMPAIPAGQNKSHSSPATYHTPFGDVLVDHLTAPNILAEFGPKNAAARQTSGQTVATADGGVTGATTAPAATQSTASSTANTASTATSVSTAVSATTATSTNASASTTPAPPTTSTPAGPPTPQSVFGANPWVQSPGGTSVYGATFQYNPVYFATQQTAQKVASMVGGTVIQQNAIIGDISSPFHQNQSNYMVQLPGGGVINPGLIADFYNHGYPQSTVDQMIKNEVQGTIKAAQDQTQGV